jgi:glycerol-3-phosphate dehydrogenase
MSATAATRDDVLTLGRAHGAPVLDVFGGMITTCRKLAEGALDRIAEVGPRAPGPWTAGVPLPGGDFLVGGGGRLVEDLRGDYPFLTARWALRRVRAYGTEARAILGAALSPGDLGDAFGPTLRRPRSTGR